MSFLNNWHEIQSISTCHFAKISTFQPFSQGLRKEEETWKSKLRSNQHILLPAFLCLILVIVVAAITAILLLAPDSKGSGNVSPVEVTEYQMLYWLNATILDCKWSNWGSWGCLCTGTKSRSRTQIGPKKGGRQCTGSSSESTSDTSCDTSPCGEDRNKYWARKKSLYVVCKSLFLQGKREQEQTSPNHVQTLFAGPVQGSAKRLFPGCVKIRWKDFVLCNPCTAGRKTQIFTMIDATWEEPLIRALYDSWKTELHT